jgi:hypothetical protein
VVLARAQKAVMASFQQGELGRVFNNTKESK